MVLLFTFGSIQCIPINVYSIISLLKVQNLKLKYKTCNINLEQKTSNGIRLSIGLM